MSEPLLEKINYPKDLRKLNKTQLPELAKEVRSFILNVVATKEGHLGASLGVTDLSIALHYFYNTPNDQIIWDVGHQAYAHKLLTGRREGFKNLRQLNGMSGFPVRDESEYDVFGTGHSSTSISAITGIAVADQLRAIKREHIAVIGDASIVSGMALEGLNFLGDSDLNVTVILNDNNIGIDHSVGGLSKAFNSGDLAVSSSFFKAFGLKYFGIINGHDIEALCTVFKLAKSTKGPKVIHIKTIKGKGYSPAEADQIGWHAPGKFNLLTSERTSQTEETYPNVVGDTLIEIFRQTDNAVAISPAMLTGSSLIKLKAEFPDRVFDVGIAEQHAVTFAAGLATQGYQVFCVIYSTFLQRAWDQVIHDVALQNLPITFCIDRAGVVGTDGATHHGMFDVSLAMNVPNVWIASPKDKHELQLMLKNAESIKHPLFIRYPKVKAQEPIIKKEIVNAWTPKIYNPHCLKTIVCTGVLSERIIRLVIGNKWAISVLHIPLLKPLSQDKLKASLRPTEQILLIDEAMPNSILEAMFLNFIIESKYEGEFKIKSLPDAFIPHGQLNELKTYLGFDDQQLFDLIKDFFKI